MLSKLSKSFSRFKNSATTYFKSKRTAYSIKQSEQEAEYVAREAETSTEQFVEAGKEKMVGYWLLGAAGTVLATIGLAGYVKINNHDLKMAGWRPFGRRYPNTETEWKNELRKYEKTMEYEVAKDGLVLEEFKLIYTENYLFK